MDSTMMWVIGGGVVAALAVLFVVFFSRYSKLAEDLDTLEARQQPLVAQTRTLQMTIAALEKDKAELIHKRDEIAGHLDTADRDNEHYKAELAKRPKVEKKNYRILTVGMKATGKSSLTLKWANPLVDLGTIEGTKMERYERTVSLVRRDESLVQHVFIVHDWGGEHIVDAQEELVMGDIDGILMVVDLGGREARQVEQQRINEQINEFNPHALRFFLTPRIVASCKTIVLFINKSDLIPGTPGQAEAQAKAHFAPLIDSLRAYQTHIDVHVMAGSASFGHSTHILFSHFVEKILPESAYDPQLLQRIKGETRRRSQTYLPGVNGGPLPQQAQAPAAQAPAPQPPHQAPRQAAAQAPQTPPAPPPPRTPVPPRAPNKMTLPMTHVDDDANGMGQTMPLTNNRLAALAKKREP